MDIVEADLQVGLAFTNQESRITNPDRALRQPVDRYESGYVGPRQLDTWILQGTCTLTSGSHQELVLVLRVQRGDLGAELRQHGLETAADVDRFVTPARRVGQRHGHDRLVALIL